MTWIDPDKHNCLAEAKKEIEKWQKSVCEQGNAIFILREELFTLRKVVGLLQKSTDGDIYDWFITDSTEKANGLDIEKIKEGMK